MQASTKGFLLGLIIGLAIIFLTFGFSLTFEASQEYDITLTLVICSLAGFIIGWIFEGIKQQ